MNIEKIINLISKEEKNISSIEGKDIIIIIGQDEIGKSTIINGFLGVHFRRYKCLIEPIPPEKYIIPIIHSLDQISIYKFHTLCNPKNSDFYFLEIPGFCKNRNEKLKNIVLSIFLQMIINLSKTIRLIFLNKCSIFDFGVRSLYIMKQELNRFFIQDYSPVYCLFNQFTLTKNLINEKFMLWTEEKQNDIIKNDLREKFFSNCKTSDNNQKNKLKRIIQREKDEGPINKSGDENEMNKILNQSLEYQEIKKENASIEILKNTFSKSYFGYIDPTSQSSIKRIQNDILNLPPMDSSSISLNEENSGLENFKELFSQKINNEIIFTRQLFFSKTYPEEEIDIIIKEISQRIKVKQSIMAQIENKSMSSKFSNELLKEFNQEIELMKSKLQFSIMKLKEKQSALEQSFHKYTYQSKYEIWNENFEKIVGYLNFDDLDKYKKKFSNQVIPTSQYVALMNLKENKFNLNSYFAIPQKIYQQFLMNFNEYIANIKEQIINFKAKLELLNQITDKKIEEKLRVLIYIFTQNVMKINIIKKCVHKTISIYKEEFQKNESENNTRVEYEMYYNIIKKLYKNYQNFPILNEFIQIYEENNSKSTNKRMIEIESLISDGNIIFMLNGG